MTTWNLSGTMHHVFICNGGSCTRNGAEEVTRSIRQEITSRAADPYLHTTRTRCNGRCEDACVVIVYPEGVWYQNVTAETGRRIVEEHLVGGRVFQSAVSYRYGEKGLFPVSGLQEGFSKPN